MSNPWKHWNIPEADVSLESMEEREEQERAIIAEAMQMTREEARDSLARDIEADNIRNGDGLGPAQMAQQTQTYQMAVRELGRISEIMRKNMHMTEEDAAQLMQLTSVEEWREHAPGLCLPTARGTMAFGRAFDAYIVEHPEANQFPTNDKPTLH